MRHTPGSGMRSRQRGGIWECSADAVAANLLPDGLEIRLFRLDWTHPARQSMVTPSVEWSLPIDQLRTGAKYYQYNPQEARRPLTAAGHPKDFKTQLTATSGLGRDLVDAVQLVQRFLRDVGIEVELKLQEYGA